MTQGPYSKALVLLIPYSLRQCVHLWYHTISPSASLVHSREIVNLCHLKEDGKAFLFWQYHTWYIGPGGRGNVLQLQEVQFQSS